MRAEVAGSAAGAWPVGWEASLFVDGVSLGGGVDWVIGGSVMVVLPGSESLTGGPLVTVVPVEDGTTMVLLVETVVADVPVVPGLDLPVPGPGALRSGTIIALGGGSSGTLLPVPPTAATGRRAPA